VRALEKYISVLVMHFKDRDMVSGRNRLVPRGRGHRKTKLIFTVLFLALLTLSLIINESYAELLDRIVAVVNREVVLYSELQGAAEKAKAAGEEKSDIEILEELINRTLLLEQAMKFRIGMETYNHDDGEARKMIDDYINRRIKAFIHVPFEEIESFYMSHKDDLGGRDVYGAWDEIENRLRIDQLKVKLDEHIALLRKEAYIRIQLDNMR
jgi:hypothetical protein